MALTFTATETTGEFIEKEFGKSFSYRPVQCEWLKAEGCTHEIYTAAVHGSPWRGAVIKKTVANVLVDECEDTGALIWEKWSLKKNVVFS